MPSTAWRTARPAGSWGSGQYRWAPATTWFGPAGYPGPLPEDEARVAVVSAWLRAFGPGTVDDLKWWTGFGVTQVRKALASVGAVDVDLDGVSGVVLPDDLDPVADPGPWVAVLPPLDPTALVHEAYLRLVGEQRFETRRHFFAAAAEAMRRILIDHARKRNRAKRGGDRERAELDDAAAPDPDSRLIALDADSDKPIDMIVSSPGGHLESGDAIHDIIRFIAAPENMIGTGWVGSAATHLYLSVPKERRFCTPNTRFLIHQPSGGAGGPASDIAIEAKEIIKMRQRINKSIAEATGQALEKVERDTDRNFWMNAEEARAYGIVTNIVKSVDQIK